MKKYNIMVVDDNEEILKVIKRFLSLKEDIEVYTETNPLNALKTVKGNKFHIILVDIQMPEMDGIEFLREIKRIDPFIQIIMITAYSTTEKIISAFELGANDFVIKPFESLDKLWYIIDNTIQKIERWKQVLKQTIEK